MKTEEGIGVRRGGNGLVARLYLVQERPGGKALQKTLVIVCILPCHLPSFCMSRSMYLACSEPERYACGEAVHLRAVPAAEAQALHGVVQLVPALHAREHAVPFGGLIAVDVAARRAEVSAPR